MKRMTQGPMTVLLAFGLFSAPALAGSADQVRVRVAGFRQLGAAYKAVMDGMRANDLAKIRQGSAQIASAGQGIYGWFPRGSGPQPGVKTAVKPEVWMKPAEFRAAQDAFSREARAFQQVAARGDINAVRGSARSLGAACKSCHDSFRVPSD